jgi:hypothetical protein
MIFLLWLALTCPKGQAQTGLGTDGKPTCWAPADIMASAQNCGMDGHRHSLDLDEHGRFVVNKEKGEPNIVFDGLCHDESEKVVVPDSERKVLPVPKPNKKGKKL